MCRFSIVCYGIFLISNDNGELTVVSLTYFSSDLHIQSIRCHAIFGEVDNVWQNAINVANNFYHLGDWDFLKIKLC